jgi:putative tricarboxylic transport membrane protein
VNRPVVRAGRWFALLIAASGIAAALEAWRAMPMGTADDPGPGLLPLVLGLAVGALGFATALGRTWPAAAPILRGRAFAVASAVAAWALALPYLGFAVSTIAALFLNGRAIGTSPIARQLMFALVAGGGASLLFRGLLKLPLPRGPWGW